MSSENAIITAARMGGSLDTNDKPAFVRCTSQNVTNDSFPAVVFNQFTSRPTWAGTVAADGITIKENGLYKATAWVKFPSGTASGTRYAWISHPGFTTIEAAVPPVNGDVTILSLMGLIDIWSAPQLIELYVNQTSGGTINGVQAELYIVKLQ